MPQRRLQFGLGSLFGLMTVVAVIAAISPLWFLGGMLYGLLIGSTIAAVLGIAYVVMTALYGFSEWLEDLFTKAGGRRRR